MEEYLLYFSMFGNNGGFLSGSITDDDRTIMSNDQQQQRDATLSDLTNKIFFDEEEKTIANTGLV